MFAKIARQCGNRLAAALDRPPEAADIAAYALENIFLTIANLLVIVVTAVVLDLFWPMITACLTGAIFRSVSGGAHLSTSTKCIVFSTVITIMLALIGNIPIISLHLYHILTILILFLGFSILFKYSPAAHENKPISASSYWALKTVSLCFLLIWGLIIFLSRIDLRLKTVSSLSLLWQLLSITPVSFRLYRVIDHMMSWRKEVNTNA